MNARFARHVAPYVGVGILFLGASFLYHYPSVLAGAVSVEDDLKVFYFPLLVATAHALAQGELALWSPAIFGGYPLFADGEAGMLYPFHLLLLPWLAPEPALVALRVIHSALAGIFTLALLRALGCGFIGSSVAGLVYAYSGVAAGQVIHANVFHGMVWLPLQLCFVEQAFRSSGGPRLRYALLAGAAVGIQALAVHVHVTLMCALTIGLFVAYRVACGAEVGALVRSPGRAHLAATARGLVTQSGLGVTILIIVGLIGIGIGAVQLFPLLELGGQTFRGNGLDPKAASVNSVWWGDLATLLLPRLYDTATGGYWGLWVKWETVLYVGIAPLVLALLGLVLGRGPHRGFFVGLGLVGLLVAFGGNAPISGWALLHTLPGFDVLRSPGRFSLLFAIAIAVLAGYGVDWLAGRRRVHARLALVVLTAGGGLTLLLGVALRQASRYFATPNDNAWLLDQYLHMPGIPTVVDGAPFGRDRLADLAAAALDPGGFWPQWQLLLVFATAVVLALWLLGPRVRPVALTSTLAIVFVDLWLVGLTFHPYLRIDQLRPQVPPVLLAAADGPFRVYTPPTAGDKTTQVEPNRLLTARIHEATGYSSLEPDRHAAYVNAIQFADNHLLDLWNVRYVVRRNRPELLPSHAGTSFHPQRPLFTGRGTTPGAGGTLLPDGEDARVNEVIVISSLWQAAAVPDGKEVARVVLRGADGQTRSLQMVAGRHVSDGSIDVPGATVEMRHGRAEVAFQYQRSNPAGERFGEQLYAGRLRVDPPMTVKEVEVQPETPDGGLQVYGVGLFDAATGEVTQARHKGKYQLVHRDNEIRIFENRGVMPRAFLVHEARIVPAGHDVLAQMVDGPFDPRTTALIEDPPPGVRLPLAGAPGQREAAASASAAAPAAQAAYGTANVVSYADNSVVIRTAADRAGVLVLTDTSYPGWVADVDGRPTPVLRANYLFRGVAVPAGEHVVTFSFRPRSVALGAVVTLLASFPVLVMPFVPALVRLARWAWLAKPSGLPSGRVRRTAEPMADLP